MKGENNWKIVIVVVGIALLTAATAAAGIFLRGGEAFEVVTSVRGEVWEMATSGIYAWNAKRLVAEGVGWDVFTLLFAVPALLFALPGLARDRLGAQLFTLGILAYLFYQYLMYAVTWAFGPLFLPFVAIYALSLVGIAFIVTRIPVPELPDRFGDDFPRKGMAILSFVLAALLLLMWLGRIVPALGGEIDGVLLGQTTLVVKAFAMACAICAMLIVAWIYEDRLEVPPLMIFGTAAAVSAWLGMRMFRSLEPI